MTKSQKIITLLAVVILITCSYIILHPANKEEILRATRDEPMTQHTLSLYSDGTYNFKIKYQTFDDSIKTELITGKYYLKGDTLYFPGGVKKSNVNKATIKNNVVELIGTAFDGLSIIKTKLILKPAIDPKKYPNLTIYTYRPEFDAYFERGSKPYDLQEKDVILLNNILVKQPKNSLPGKCGKQDHKICRAAITPKGQKEIFLECSGIAVIVNLTTKKCNRIVCFGG